VGLLGSGAAGPVFLQVGTTFVEPTVVGYEPTEGGTTDPYPSVPFCASAAVPESAKAAANAIVLSFMSCLSCRFHKGQPHHLLPFLKFIFKRQVRRQAVHISQSLDAPAIVFHRVSFDLVIVGVCKVT
jgi:hypothetical protein